MSMFRARREASKEGSKSRILEEARVESSLLSPEEVAFELMSASRELAENRGWTQEYAEGIVREVVALFAYPRKEELDS